MINIPLHRLYNQQIEHSRLKTPAEVAAWLGGIQAQDYPGAKWSVGLRLPGSTDANIEQAIADKTILRTWLMRGTLHFAAAEDIRWMVRLMAPRTLAGRMARYKELELDEQTLSRSNDLLAKAVRDGQQLTRAELFAILQVNGISTQGQRGVHMLQKASLDGLICQGAERHRDPRFMALDESIPQGKTMVQEEAVAELTQRYFSSRGPATLQDFVAWSGLAVGDARAGLEAVKSQLVQETIDGQTYWLSAATPPAQEIAPHLLPGFDEYLLGYRDRSAALDPQYAQRVCPGGNGVFRHTIVIEGRVVGTWKRTLKKGGAAISSEPFSSLTAAEKDAFAAAAQCYGNFIGMPVIPA